MTSNKSPLFDFTSKLPPMGHKLDFNKSNYFNTEEAQIVLTKRVDKKNKKKKKKIKRCQHKECKKKLPLVELKCKCEKIFCRKHFHYEKHECSFDHKTYYKNKLINKAGLGGGEGNKIDRI